MFNRRRSQKTVPQAPEGPDVYVASGPSIPGGMHRFFFAETLGEEGAAKIQSLLEPQLAFLSGFEFEPRQNYATVTWSPKTEDGRGMDEVGSDVRLIVIGALALHFGWKEPSVGTFESDEERRSRMRELNVDWSVGGR